MQPLDTLPIYDGGNAQEIFAYGVAKMEIIGPMARWHLHIPQDIGGTRYRVIVAYIDMPAATIPESIALTELAVQASYTPRLVS